MRVDEVWTRAREASGRPCLRLETARQMVDEMGDWSGDHRQHESVMRARWGGSFVAEAFTEACERLGA